MKGFFRLGTRMGCFLSRDCVCFAPSSYWHDRSISSRIGVRHFGDEVRLCYPRHFRACGLQFGGYNTGLRRNRGIAYSLCDSSGFCERWLCPTGGPFSFQVLVALAGFQVVLVPVQGKTRVLGEVQVLSEGLGLVADLCNLVSKGRVDYCCDYSDRAVGVGG